MSSSQAPPDEEPPPPPPVTLAPFTSDSFSGGDLATYVGRTTDAVLGGTSVKVRTSNGAAKLAIRAGELVPGSSTTGHFAAVAMPTADQSLTVRVVAPPTGSGTRGVHLVVRRSSLSASASYRATLGPTTAELQRTDSSGTPVRLAEPVGYAAGDTLEVRVVGTVVSLHRNGALAAQATDTAVTRAGFAGLSAGSQATGFRLDDVVWNSAG
jgi:hypothetical protein